jgi:branched-subunit amino acid transport protein
MIKFNCLRAFKSLEFLGIMVLAAVVLTSVIFSTEVERDPSLKRQSLIYSHLVSVQTAEQSPAPAPIDQ